MSKIESTIESFTEAASSNGWLVSCGRAQHVELPTSITERYRRIPEDFLMFLACVRECRKQDQSAWFFCVEDYKHTDDEGWCWNDFEKMSLEAADDDDELTKEIKQFWDSQLPIAYVVPDYAYLSLSVSPDDFGAVFYGFMHYFEEPKRVADSLQGYLSRLTDCLTGTARVEYKNEHGDDCVIRQYADFCNEDS